MAGYFPDRSHTSFISTGKPLSYAADSIVTVYLVRYNNESPNIDVVPQSPVTFTCESTPAFLVARRGFSVKHFVRFGVSVKAYILI